jgi:hypothetical protein
VRVVPSKGLRRSDRRKDRRSADVLVPQMPYIRGQMQTPSSQQAVLLRPADTRRVFCAMCEHTEFVHGDVEARRCLYSECGCGGFTLGAVE